jgi:hypothetical protein
VRGLRGPGRPQKLPALRLNAGIHNIDAEVARTPSSAPSA